MVGRVKRLAAVIGLVFGLTGCWTLHGHFEPVKADRKIIMFEQYQVVLTGNVKEWPYLKCQVDFLTPRMVTDLAKVQFDTIPQFIVDSMCLEGSCLGSTVCYRPISTRELDREIELTRRRVGVFDDPATRGSYPVEDIYHNRFQVDPVNYRVDSMPPLSEACKKRDVQVMLYARLLDRVSGRLLAQEARRVQFEISNRHYIRDE